MSMFGFLATIALIAGSPPIDDPKLPPASTQRVDFDTQIKPIFQARCLNCHAKGKYKGSFLGLLWSMLNPAVTLMVYYVVFKYFLVNPAPDFARCGRASS